jgi:hypothetical protein
MENQSGDGETARRYVGGDIGEELAAELDRELENEDGDDPGIGDNVSYWIRLPISSLLR